MEKETRSQKEIKRRGRAVHKEMTEENTHQLDIKIP